MAEHASLFFAALVAATLLPVQSELLLAALHASGRHERVPLVAVATAGNVLGSVITWLMGRSIVRFQHRRWFPFRPAAIERATGWFRRWGVWSLLFAWVPIVGDPLTLVAGILRVNFWIFIALVTVGKAGRYWAVVTAF